MVAYSMPMTLAPTTARLRGSALRSTMSSLSTTSRRRTECRPAGSGAVPTAMMNRSASNACSSPASVVTSTRCGSMKRATPATGATPLRANWCSSTSTSWSSVMRRRGARSSPLDVLLDAVGAAVEAALAPAREVEHRLAQASSTGSCRCARRRRRPAAASRRPARTSSELRRLDRRAPAGRTAADDDEIVLLHACPPKSCRRQTTRLPAAARGGKIAGRLCGVGAPKTGP